MKRKDVLARAAEIVSGQRDETYGAPEDSFTTIAALWSAYLGDPGAPARITPADVAVMMALLKIARIRTNPAHDDSWIDLAGYAACGAEAVASDPPTSKELAMSTDDSNATPTAHAREVEGLLKRIDAAIERVISERVISVRAAMRISADPTDPDLVLAEARDWIKQAALARPPAAVLHGDGSGEARPPSPEACTCPSGDGSLHWPCPVHPPEAPPVSWRPMDTAPRDGTMVRLLVDFEDHATEDAEGPSATIGANYFDHSGEDRWQFAGWCWTHDHFTDGQGTPVGWLPMLAEGVQKPAAVLHGDGSGEALPGFSQEARMGSGVAANEARDALAQQPAACAHERSHAAPWRCAKCGHRYAQQGGTE